MRARALLVARDPIVLDALRTALDAVDCDVLAAASVDDALAIAEELRLTLVVLDGLADADAALLARMRAEHPDVVRLVLVDERALPLRAVNEAGAFRLVPRGAADAELRHAVVAAIDRHTERADRARRDVLAAKQITALRSSQRSLDARQRELVRDLAGLRARAARSVEETVAALAAMADMHLAGVGAHGARVEALCEATARRLDLGDDERALLRIAARLHDVGKVGVPPEALFFPEDYLRPKEREARRAHAAFSAAIVERLSGCSQAAHIIRHHHESWDGSGYPDGLAGEAIPIGARILRAADALDVARHPTDPTAKPLAGADALAVLREEEPARFDPRVVAALLEAETANAHAA